MRDFLSRLVFAALLVLVATFAQSQNTVTGTVQDSNGNPYANGTASAVTVPAAGQPSRSTTPVATNSAGAFSLSLATNTYIFTICAPPTNTGPLANPTPKQVCFSSGPIAISGNIDISSTLNPLAALLGPGTPPIPSATVATLPSAALNTSRLYRVTDGQTSGDCTVGGGATTALCISNGVSWVGAGGSSASWPSLGGGTNSTSTFTCGTGCAINTSGSGTNAATSVPYSGNTAGSNITAKTEGTGGSLSPLNIGQVAGSQVWMRPPLVAPTVTVTLTGGTIQSGHTIVFANTLNSALGESLPSTNTQGGMTTFSGGCSSGTICTASINPTVPTGYTGYTAYFCDLSAGAGCSAPVKVLACVNINTTCTVTSASLNSGVALPTVDTSIIQPTGTTGNNECPQGVLPSIWAPDTSGNFHSWAGVDWNSSNGQTSGTFEICHRTWFTDEQVTPPGGHNCFVCMDHRSGTGTATNNQDRTLWLFHQTPSGDTGTHYALEGIQSELDILATGAGFAINGSPDGEAVAGSFQVGDTAASNWSASGYGAGVIRASYFKNGAGALSGSAFYNVFNAQFNNGNSTYTAGTQANLFNAACTNGVGGVPTNIACNGLKFIPLLTATRFGNGNVALYVPTVALTPTAGSDFLIRNDLVNYGAYLNSLTTVAGIQMNNVATLPVTASMTITGSEKIAQPSINPPASVNCAGGASLYTYKFVGVDANGGTVSSTGINSGSTCTNPLTSGNPATISVTSAFAQQANQAQFVRIDVYRTGGPMATGRIGPLACVAGPSTTQYCSGFSDTGLAVIGVGATEPSVNTTATQFVAGYSALNGNKAFVTSNFTTANNTNFQVITGLTFNLLPVALNYQYHCSFSYSQGTANAAVAFGIQAATVNPTNIFGTGTQQITVGPPATYVSGTLATLATTTATAIVSGTPGATGTNYTATIDGTVENPANDAGQVLNFVVSTAAGADAVTVLRGSYCYLY